ncbi:PiggyBac transposable element-derived protein 4 [Araneus ventricosus]|uniref:PiggyBac transposable element-derived protein 4 n=1 Tax=Araneus ventricosus TaxID=182803 RepID=A0A4Y2XAI3_ARAVE|nr:PiggyBac transposable element-derived protein 4 [Araneus ventricosus]
MKEYEHYGLSTKCVLTLIHELKNNGYLLTTDNFYTSPEVAEILLKYKTDVIGTVRGNRKGLPAEFKTMKLKKGEIKAFQKGKIMVLQWRDKKTLIMLSTTHNAELVSVESRKSTTKQKLKVVVDYNRSMGGVDKSDQCLLYYPSTRSRQRKYYKKYFDIYLTRLYGMLLCSIRKMEEI